MVFNWRVTSFYIINENDCCFSLVVMFTQACPTLCDPMDCRMPGFPVLHHLPEFAQTHAHWVSDAIQPSHPLSFPSPPAFSLSQNQGLFRRVGSSHQVAKVLELQQYSVNIQGWFPLGLTGLMPSLAPDIINSVTLGLHELWSWVWMLALLSSSCMILHKYLNCSELELSHWWVRC